MATSVFAIEIIARNDGWDALLKFTFTGGVQLSQQVDHNTVEDLAKQFAKASKALENIRHPPKPTPKAPPE